MNVSLQRITTDEHMYTWAMEQLCVAFPQTERRDDDLQRKVLSHPDYRLCAIVADDLPIGVVGYWLAPQFVYFENFCVDPSFRNRGVGSSVLQLLVRRHCLPSDSQTNAFVDNCDAQSLLRSFILEAELPTDELTCRRVAFYLRNGMVANPFRHIQPHYRKNDPDLELLVLSYKQQLTSRQ